MKSIKKLYYSWVEETEEDTNFRAKKHPLYKELRAQVKEHSDKMKIAGFLIGELADEDYRCNQAMILLKLIAKKNVVPRDFRDNLDVSSELWTEWFENIMLSETYFV